MSPMLENWYPQTTCKYCDEPICFIQDEMGNSIPTNSDGSDHRRTCSARKPEAPPVEIPAKPKWDYGALTHEMEFEGQKTLARWFDE